MSTDFDRIQALTESLRKASAGMPHKPTDHTDQEYLEAYKILAKNGTAADALAAAIAKARLDSTASSNSGRIN
jgi:hypothetical protein